MTTLKDNIKASVLDDKSENDQAVSQKSEESGAESEQQQEDESEEIIDLDFNDEEADPNKRTSQKDVFIKEENTIVKDNLNTQITTNGEKLDHEKKSVSPLNLHKIDFNTIPKDEIVNFLLNNKDLFDSTGNEIIENQKIAKKAKKGKKDKYINVESSFKQTKIKPNYFLSNSLNDPELVADYNTACSRVIKKALDDKNEDKHMKLLVTKKGVKKSRNVKFKI